MIKFITIVLMFLSITSFSQTESEMNMMYEINSIRKDPKSFIPTVNDYITDLESKNVIMAKLGKPNYYNNIIKDAKELIKVLNITKPMDTLVFDTSIYLITVNHANYLKEIGKIGHVGRNGSTLFDRTKKYMCSENVAKIDDNVILILMVDSYVPSRGHRNNILDKDALTVSISINDFCVVQNFGHVVYK